MPTDSEGIHEIINTRNSARTADIVFVHGLDGSSHSTWRYGEEGEEGHFFWPEELGKELPHCAVWSVGYAAGITGLGNPGMIIDQRAGNIAGQLSNLGIGERPVVFITHSMGGLVVKALIVNCPLKSNLSRKRLVENIRGIVFCGTPHRGAAFASAAGTLTSAAGILAIVWGGIQKHVKEMGANAKQLDLLHDGFLDWHSEHPIPVEAYAESIGLFRKPWWRRPIPLGLVVPRASANPGIGDIYDVDADHLTLVKPSPAIQPIYNLVYLGVLRFIKETLEPTASSIPKPPVLSSIPQPPAVPPADQGPAAHGPAAQGP